MNESRFRLAYGGRIDRERPLRFTFDGRAMTGFAGDTLASALIANGVRLVGRSFKYHRPRGIAGIGAEEPNALVTLVDTNGREPNVRATMLSLCDGLDFVSQHAWPSLEFDIGAINGLIAPLIPAGFYYKTFMGPVNSAWMVYERFIRKAAGLGRASREPDRSRYERTHAHADVLVIGAGTAGLAAALAAGKTGARVIVADEAAGPGGGLLRERAAGAGADHDAWLRQSLAVLQAMPNVSLLACTTVFGLYDGNQAAAVERCRASAPMDEFAPRERLWLIRAGQIVLATGAIEQPLLFEGNDRPGVMLAGAVRGYVNQYAALPGRRAVIVTNNDDAYRTAADLAASGVEVAAIVDQRAKGGAPPGGPDLRDVAVKTGARIRRVRYSGRIRAVEIETPSGLTRLECDLVAMSGGWAPAVHLSTHLGGKPVYDEARGLFLPAPARLGISYAGAVNGEFTLDDCIAGGERAGREAASKVQGAWPSAAAIVGAAAQPLALAATGPSRASLPLAANKAFVDFQNDVTVGDVLLAHREGYRSVEHLKRYTTLGMGTDQGKTANLAGLTMMAALDGKAVAATGTTTFRPPYAPVSIGALAGTETGRHLRPVRRTPMHDWHEAHGAAMADAGLWQRPQAYPQAGEDVFAASLREARMVRTRVGIVDVSTLGKIEVRGRDAAEFLDRIYASPVKPLNSGRTRYGLMLREDGMVLDDGTLTRLADQHFYLTTTTAQAAKVLAHLEYHASLTWPELEVSIVSVSDQFGAIAVAGPRSQALLSKLAGDDVFSDDGLPYLAGRKVMFADVPVLALRMSYSGERAYELHVPAGKALALWEALIAEGAGPYGTEAMAILRIEKGHVAGGEIDGRTTPYDLGLGKLLKREGNSIGRRMLQRPGLSDRSRPSLAGIVPVDGKSRIRSGAQITVEQRPPVPARMIGHVTSACFSPALESPIGLVLLEEASQRMGSVVYAQDPLRGETVAVRVVSAVFYDREGSRLHV